MVHLNDLMEQDKTMEEAETQRRLKRALNVTSSSPLYPRVPAHIHELGEMANKAKRRKHVLRKRSRQIKCLMALKRRHWEAIIQSARDEDFPTCFGSYDLDSFVSDCRRWIRKRNLCCQACVITTKLLEVLDE